MGHKFHLGQAVTYNPPRGIYAPSGAYVVTAKLPERDGAFEYRIRSVTEHHERAARESELSGMEVATDTRATPEAAPLHPRSASKKKPRQSGT